MKNCLKAGFAKVGPLVFLLGHAAVFASKVGRTFFYNFLVKILSKNYY